MHLDRPIVFIDVETTGVDVEKDHIIEIACVKVMPDRSKSTYQTFVNPGKFVPAEVTELTGITDEQLTAAPRFGDIADDMTELLRDSDLAGYNAVSFDVPILRNEFGRIGRTFPGAPDQVVLDAFEILRHFERRDLAWAYRFYTDADFPEAHRALADVEATETILREQILRYNLRGTAREIAAMLRHPFLDSRRRLKKDGEHVIICFGKYRGRTLKSLTESDPGYVQWMIENLDSEVVEVLRRFVRSAPDPRLPPPQETLF